MMTRSETFTVEVGRFRRLRGVVDAFTVVARERGLTIAHAVERRTITFTITGRARDVDCFTIATAQAFG